MSRILEHIIRKFLFEQDPPSEEERRQDYDKRYAHVLSPNFIAGDPKETEAKVQLFSGTNKQISAAKKLGAEKVLLVKVTYSTDTVVNPTRIYDIVEDAIAIDFKSNAAIQPYASQDYLFVIGNPSNKSVQYIPVIIVSINYLKERAEKITKSKKWQKNIKARIQTLQNTPYNSLTDEQIQSFMKMLHRDEKYLKKIEQAIAEKFFDVPAGEPYYNYTNVTNKDIYNEDLATEIHWLQNNILNAETGTDYTIKTNTIDLKGNKFNILQFLWEPDRINNLDNEYKTAIDGKTFRKDFAEDNYAQTTHVLADVTVGANTLFKNDVNGGQFITLLEFINEVKKVIGNDSDDLNLLNSFINTKGYMNADGTMLSSLYQVNYMINSKDSLMLTILKDLGLPVKKQITIPEEHVKLYKNLPIIHRILYNYNQLPDEKKQKYDVSIDTLKNIILTDTAVLYGLNRDIRDDLPKPPPKN